LTFRAIRTIPGEWLMDDMKRGAKAGTV